MIFNYTCISLHIYRILTDTGIEYLRNFLHLPADIVPATHKKAAAARLPGGTVAESEDARAGGKEQGGFKQSFKGEGGGFGRGKRAN